MSVWEHCDLGPSLEDHLVKIAAASEQSAPSSGSRKNLNEANSVKAVINGSAGAAQQGIEEMQSHFGAAENSCRGVLEELDSILAILEDVSNEYEDVTSRTNSLVMNCESVLEQQRELEATVGKLHGVLGPFNELEQVALLLGVPFDPHMNPAGDENDAAKKNVVDIRKRSGGGNTISDPRSPEFRQALHRLAKASAQVDQHPDFQDAGKYKGWLKQLQGRALGLISRGIRSLLDNASQQASDLMAMAAKQRKMAVGSSISLRGSQAATTLASDEQPLESAAIYKKFRGLSFRVRELVTLLEPSAAPVMGSPTASPVKGGGFIAGSDEDDTLLTLGSLAESTTVLREVTSSYVSLRTKLLTPFLIDTLKQAAISSGVKAGSRGGGSPRNGRGTPTNLPSGGGSSDSLTSTGSADSGPGASSTGRSGSLCGYLRQAFSSLHRLAQLELQLYESLFVSDDETGEGEVMKTSNTGSKTDYREALAVVEAAGAVVADALRPPIIHEDSVEELCRVISVLGEDVRAHTMNARLPIQLRKELLRGLDKTISDAQERLNYCAEVTLRQEVTKFTPSPAQVAYPDLLETAAAAAQKEKGGEELPEGGTATATTSSGDVSRLWYPTLRSSLSLLSRLYSVVESSVFEDFARRSVDECVQSLRRGAEAVRKKSGDEMVGSLFLVRHLLVLREQLIPFDIRLQGSERKLDFGPTGEALAALRGSLQDALKFNRSNGLLRFAREGLPQMQESMLDVQGELDRVLKVACGHLRDAALKMLVGADVDGLLAKVEAFAGDIPVEHAKTSALGDTPLAARPAAPPALSSEVATKLRGQAFLRPERLLTVFTDAQQAVEHTLPELKHLMTIFIDSPVARAILLKPVQQGLEMQKSKMLSVIAACVDHGQNRRDIEQLLAVIHDHINSELNT